jgi:hypothetical protein
VSLRAGVVVDPGVALHLNRFLRTFGAAEPAKPFVSRLMKHFSERQAGRLTWRVVRLNIC